MVQFLMAQEWPSGAGYEASSQDEPSGFCGHFVRGENGILTVRAEKGLDPCEVFQKTSTCDLGE